MGRTAVEEGRRRQEASGGPRNSIEQAASGRMGEEEREVSKNAGEKKRKR